MLHATHKHLPQAVGATGDAPGTDELDGGAVGITSATTISGASKDKAFTDSIIKAITGIRRASTPHPHPHVYILLPGLLRGVTRLHAVSCMFIGMKAITATLTFLPLVLFYFMCVWGVGGDLGTQTPTMTAHVPQ